MKLGVEVFLEKHVKAYKGKRIGLLTNLTGVNRHLQPTIDLFYKHPGITLTTLFGPEHGLRGEVKEGELIKSSVDPYTNLPVYSLYKKEKKPENTMLDDVDIVICDLQDIGTRYYTFIYTIANMMKLCGEHGKKVVILDRPNPINGDVVEGNRIQEGFMSFVGQYPIAVRHGLTIGEMAVFFNEQFRMSCDLKVIRMEGWSRDLYFDQTELLWVSPTPNTTGLDMCLLYPGTCLIEGTNVSEGRGTTKPFEIIGAPFINGRKLADELNSYKLDGVLFRSTVFKPQYSKFSGVVCEGVQIHVAERSKLKAFNFGLTLLQALYKLYPTELTFIKSNDSKDHYFIDLLAGTEQLRKQLQTGNLDDFMHTIKVDEDTFRSIRSPYLLY